MLQQESYYFASIDILNAQRIRCEAEHIMRTDYVINFKLNCFFCNELMANCNTE